MTKESEILIKPRSIGAEISETNKNRLASLRKRGKNKGTKILAGLASLSVAAALLSQPTSSSENSNANIGGTYPENTPAGDIFIPTPTETPKVIEAETLEDVLADIEDEYGVIIPAPAKEFSQEDRNNNNALTPNIVPTLEQAKIIKDDLALLPSPGYFAPLLIVFRNAEDQAVAGGSALGWQWPAFYHPSEFSNFPPNNFPYDRLVDRRYALELNIPDTKLSDPLPVKTNESANLPVIAQIALEGTGVKVNTHEDVPWTTHGERLKQVVLHEYFHAIQDAFSLANSPDVSEYWKRQYYTLFDMSTGDITNPLYVTFAEINGWKLVKSSEIAKIYDPEYAKANAEKIETWDTLFFQKDPAVWGDLANRRNRITVYASYGPIQEALCEYYMAYKLYPNLLTDKERAYFKIIDNGLKTNPQEFINAVVKNPDILFENTTLDTNSNLK